MVFEQTDRQPFFSALMLKTIHYENKQQGKQKTTYRYEDG